MDLTRPAILCTVLFAVQPALGAEFRFAPSLAASEEFNDNVHDSAADRKSEFITRLQPGAGLLFRAPAFSADLTYSFDYHHYARQTRDDEENHYLNLRASAEVVENFFFVEGSDTLSRVSLDVARDVTGESLYANQTDQNRATVSPYLLWRLGDRGRVRTGYRFTDTSYWSAPGIDKREQRAFADASHDASARLNFTLGYAWSRTATDLVDYDQHDAEAGFRYEYADRSFIHGGIGNSWQLPSVGSNTSNLVWNAGVNRDFGTLVAAAETRVQYTEDPLSISTKETSYVLSLEKPLRRATVRLATAYRKYAETVDSGTDRRKAEVAAYWLGELTSRLKAGLTVIGDKVSRESPLDYAYHLSTAAELSFSLNHDVTAAFRYSYVEYRRDLESSENARQTNRAILSLSKVF